MKNVKEWGHLEKSREIKESLRFKKSKNLIDHKNYKGLKKIKNKSKNLDEKYKKILKTEGSQRIEECKRLSMNLRI